MEIKIIGKSIVPDRILLYENDLGAKNLVFTSTKVNDGVNFENLNAYLEVEREEGFSDRFLLDKTVSEEVIYFTLPVNLALTQTADLLSSQIVFENQEKTLSYRSKVFYIEVKNSVDGISSYEQIAPTVISQLESKMEKTVEDCESIKSEIEHTKEEFENNVEETSSKIKEEVLSQLGDVIADDFLSTESKNPVQNKIITEKINEITIKVDDTLSAESENPVQNKVIKEALDGKVKKNTSFNSYMKVYGQTSSGEEKMYEFSYSPKSGNLAYYDYSELGAYDNDGNIIKYNTGAVSTSIPSKPTHATPKKWVEDLVETNKGTKLYKHTITGHIENTGDGLYFAVEFYSFSENVDYQMVSDSNYNSCDLLISSDSGFLTGPFVGTSILSNPEPLSNLLYFSYGYADARNCEIRFTELTDWWGKYISHTIEHEVVGV